MKKWIQNGFLDLPAKALLLVFSFLHVAAFGATPNILGKYEGTTNNSLFIPTDVDIGPDGTIYVANTGDNSILEFSPNSSLDEMLSHPVRRICSDSIKAPSSIGVDSKKRIWFTADDGVYYIEKGVCYRQPVEEERIGMIKNLSIQRGNDPCNDTAIISVLGVGQNKYAYLHESKVVDKTCFCARLPSKTFESLCLQTSSHQMGLLDRVETMREETRNIKGFYGKIEKEIWALNSLSSGGQVKVLNQRSSLSIKPKVGNKAIELLEPEDVVKNSNDFLWISNAAAHRLEKFKIKRNPTTGEVEDLIFIASLGPDGFGEKPLHSPSGIATGVINGKNVLAVIDSNNHALYILEDAISSQPSVPYVKDVAPLEGVQNGPINVQAQAWDEQSGIETVIFNYTTQGSTPDSLIIDQNIALTPQDTELFQGIVNENLSDIRKTLNNQGDLTVTYKIVARNRDGQTASTEERTFILRHAPGCEGAICVVDLVTTPPLVAGASPIAPRTQASLARFRPAAQEGVKLAANDLIWKIERDGKVLQDTQSAQPGDTIHLGLSLLLGKLAGWMTTGLSLSPGEKADCLVKFQPGFLNLRPAYGNLAGETVVRAASLDQFSISPDCTPGNVTLKVAITLKNPTTGEENFLQDTLVLPVVPPDPIQKLFLSQKLYYQGTPLRIFLASKIDPASLDGMVTLSPRSKPSEVITVIPLKEFRPTKNVSGTTKTGLYFSDFKSADSLKPGWHTWRISVKGVQESFTGGEPSMMVVNR